MSNCNCTCCHCKKPKRESLAEKLRNAWCQMNPYLRGGWSTTSVNDKRAYEKEAECALEHFIEVIRDYASVHCLQSDLVDHKNIIQAMRDSIKGNE